MEPAGVSRAVHIAALENAVRDNSKPAIFEAKIELKTAPTFETATGARFFLRTDSLS